MISTTVFRPLNSLFKLGLLLLSLGVAFNVQALELSTAKQNGWVGEQRDGYLGLVQPKPEAKQLIKTVNQKRLDLYKKLAKQHSLSVDQVAQRAGTRNIERTKAGQMIQSPSGQWIKK